MCTKVFLGGPGNEREKGGEGRRRTCARRTSWIGEEHHAGSKGPPIPTSRGEMGVRVKLSIAGGRSRTATIAQNKSGGTPQLKPGEALGPADQRDSASRQRTRLQLGRTCALKNSRSPGYGC